MTLTVLAAVTGAGGWAFAVVNPAGFAAVKGQMAASLSSLQQLLPQAGSSAGSASAERSSLLRSSGSKLSQEQAAQRFGVGSAYAAGGV